MTSGNPNRNFTGVIVPPVVFELAAGRPVAPVWRNQIGGVTYELGRGEEFVKYGPPHPEFAPVAEAERLSWLGAFVAAPG